MPKQLWETEDGSVFDTAEEAIRYENECELANKLTYHININCQALVMLARVKRLYQNIS